MLAVVLTILIMITALFWISYWTDFYQSALC